jgi:hypothetical protein
MSAEQRNEGDMTSNTTEIYRSQRKMLPPKIIVTPRKMLAVYSVAKKVTTVTLATCEILMQERVRKVVEKP